MFEVQPEQYAELEKIVTERQAREILQTFAQEVAPIDAPLAEQVRQYALDANIDFFLKLLNLTTVAQYQKFLLFAYLNTKINFFNEPEFEYILQHPALSGNAKARHLAVSGYAASQGSIK